MTLPPIPPAAAPVQRLIPHHSSLSHRLSGFVVWIFTGFGLLHHLTGDRRDERIVVYAVHPSFFLWAMLLVGFVGARCVDHWPHTAGVWGWLYLWTLLYTLVTLLYDLSTARFLLWVGIFSFVWLAGRYVEDLKHIPVLTPVLAHFAGLKPALNPGFAAVISWLLLPAWVGSLFQTFTRGRKVFTPNSIEEHYLGEGTEVTDRSGLKFRTRYNDLFEGLLGLGAGNLEAVDQAGVVVKRWPHILFLAFTWHRLDALLHQRAALVDNPRVDPVAVEEVK